jgi:hypothetical protein
MSRLHSFIPSTSLPHWLGGSLPEEEAMDEALIQTLLSPEREYWYKQRINNLLNLNIPQESDE